jgi:hypothetical protein
MLYFANAYGILEFDGVSWTRIDLPDGNSAVSFSKNSKGEIFVGSVGEIGQLKTDSLGRNYYFSLRSRIPDVNANFGEVWKTFAIGDDLIFSAFSQITVLNENGVKLFHPRKGMTFDFSGQVDDQIFIRESGKGLLRYENDQLNLVAGGEHFSNSVIYAVHRLDKDNLLIISDRGFEKYDGTSFEKLTGAADTFIRENEISCAIPLKNGYGAIGSVSNGILIFDNNGNPLQHLTKKIGLASDYILGLYADLENNIWAATDNGISHIQTSSPFTAISDDTKLEGMGYAACVFDQKLYLGTSKGLFVRNWKPYENPLDPARSFKIVPGTEGQVWYVAAADGVLLCGHNRGLFQIKNDKAERISPDDYTGGWVFRELKGKPFLIVGAYEGLECYEKKNGSWVFRNKIKGFTESSRTFEFDRDGNIWVCHGNKGLYRITLDDNLENALEVVNVAVTDNFKSDYFNDISVIGDDVVFAGENKLYRYNDLSRKLEAYDQLNKVIGDDVLISKISQQPNGNIWFVNDDVIEVLIKQPDGAYVKNKSQFSKLKGQLIGSYEYFWRYDEANYYIGTESGFIHFDPRVVVSEKRFETLIRKVTCIQHGDSVVFGGTFLNDQHVADDAQPVAAILKIPYSENAMRFSFAALFYEDQDKTQYQYFLEREGDINPRKWSDWTSQTYKEYTNLWEGVYTFHLRAKNIHDQLSDEQTYKFVILSPWYRTRFAFAVYIFLFLAFNYVVVKLVVRKMKKEKQRIEREKSQELLLMEKQFAEEALRAEREIILLQNEKLETDVKYKNNELANLATSLSQKSEFLAQLKKELVSFSKENEQVANPGLTELIKTIDKGSEFDDSWDHFQTNFDAVHHNFLFNMRERYPFLKSTDLLLCAYIKINKSNKEISALLNISVSAVEKRRFRLREKLKLDDDTRLTEFLVDL